MVVGAILATGASLTAGVLVMQMAVLPLLFKYSKTVQRKIVFSNFINYPRNLNYNSPSSSNIIGGRNFHVEFHSRTDDCPVKLGAWHLLPCCAFRGPYTRKEKLPADSKLWQELATTKNDVVLYCHGNSNHRASPHRLQMYRVFQELNFHVVTFDYRGYGDSTKVRPTEAGVVEDALQMYAWLVHALNTRERSAPRLILWGHSLGTAVASNLVAHLSELSTNYELAPLPQPHALILEAPFNNLTEEIAGHPCSKCVSWLPYFKDTFVKPFVGSKEYAFTTDQYLSRVKDVPILIMHCKGDKIVPHELAVKLYASVARDRQGGDAPLVFHTFGKGHGLGHNNMCVAANLKNVVRDFLTLISERQAMMNVANKTVVPPPENIENIAENTQQIIKQAE